MPPGPGGWTPFRESRPGLPRGRSRLPIAAHPVLPQPGGELKQNHRKRRGRNSRKQVSCFTLRIAAVRTGITAAPIIAQAGWLRPCREYAFHFINKTPKATGIGSLSGCILALDCPLWYIGFQKPFFLFQNITRNLFRVKKIIGEIGMQKAGQAGKSAWPAGAVPAIFCRGKLTSVPPRSECCFCAAARRPRSRCRCGPCCYRDTGQSGRSHCCRRPCHRNEAFPTATRQN